PPNQTKVNNTPKAKVSLTLVVRDFKNFETRNGRPHPAPTGVQRPGRPLPGAHSIPPEAVRRPPPATRTVPPRRRAPGRPPRLRRAAGDTATGPAPRKAWTPSRSTRAATHYPRNELKSRAENPFAKKVILLTFIRID